MITARSIRIASAAAVAVSLAGLPGCVMGRAPSAARGHSASVPAIHQALVMPHGKPGPAPGRLDPTRTWEFARNDTELGAPPRALDPGYSVSVTRKRERRWIQSGRLHENTVISTSTWDRRSGR